MPLKAKPVLAPEQNSESIFWQDIDRMLQKTPENDGYLKGSLSGESWKDFLSVLRDEILEILQENRMGAARSMEFCPSILGGYREERQKIEQAYLRNLAALYKRAEWTYKTVSGQTGA